MAPKRDELKEPQRNKRFVVCQGPAMTTALLQVRRRLCASQRTLGTASQTSEHGLSCGHLDVGWSEGRLGHLGHAKLSSGAVHHVRCSEMGHRTQVVPTTVSWFQFPTRPGIHPVPRNPSEPGADEAVSAAASLLGASLH